MVGSAAAVGVVLPVPSVFPQCSFVPIGFAAGFTFVCPFNALISAMRCAESQRSSDAIPTSCLRVLAKN